LPTSAMVAISLLKNEKARGIQAPIPLAPLGRGTLS
jgi:hypothetical protein